MASNSYFSHDSNARNSDKLLSVRMKYGAEGYGIFFMILERLREETDYMSVKDYNMIAFDLRVDTSKVKSVVEDFGLFVFTEDGKYFYSESLNGRMSIMNEKKQKKSESAKKAAEARWEKEKQEKAEEQCDSNANAMQLQCESMPNKLKETKLKETKLNQTKPNQKKHTQYAGVRAHEGKTSLDDFDAFWEKYPNKIKQEQAASLWLSIDPDQTLVAEIMGGLGRWLASDQWERGIYQSPVNWLRDKRWLDEPPVAKKSSGNPFLELLEEERAQGEVLF